MNYPKPLVFMAGVLLGALLATAGIALGAVTAFNNPSQPGAAGVTMFPDGAQEITKSDANTFARCVAVYVGGAGDVTYTPCNGGTDVTVTMQAGGWLPSRASAVKSTGTTATDIIGSF